MTVTVYSKPGCVQCNATYKTLDKKGVEYSVTDVSEDQEALEFILGLGHQQAPVIAVRVDGVLTDHWSGFMPDKIAALI